jgi:DNA-binding SARP family transcriptional activator/ABC-type transport system substrate-binding protein
VEFRILGPLDVLDGDRVAFSGAGKPGALLALLLLRRNAFVSTDRLLDDLWGERPPRTALKTLQTYVSQLRRALGDDVIATRPHGYVLTVTEGACDADCFGGLLARGDRALADGEPAAAATLLSEALSLWRGPVLGELAGEPWAAADVERLEEERQQALELRIEAELALGRHAAVVGELEGLRREHPLREHLLALLMLALYRCGRQADALEAYRSGRRRLHDELGIEPTPELRRLEQQILRHDPEVSAPPARRSSPARPLGRPRRLLALAVLVLGAVGFAVWLAVGHSSSSPNLAAADTAVLVNANGKLGSAIPVGASPAHAVSGGGYLWTSNEQDGTISRVDVAGRTVETIPVGRSPEALAFADGRLWVGVGDEARVAVIDPSAGKVVAHVRVGSGPTGLAARRHELWVANSIDGTLSTVDTRSWRRLRTVRVGPQPSAVAATDDAVWVALAGSNAVVQLDREGRGAVQTVSVGNDPTALAVAGNRLWVANAQDGTVSRVDLARGVVDATVTVGGAPRSLAAGRETVWAAVAGGRLVQIDARSARVIRTSPVGVEAAAVADDGSNAWVTTLASPSSHRGGTLRVVIGDDVFACACVEPLDALPGAGWQLLDLVYDGLVAYRRVGGPGGGVLVPDLAQALPRPTEEGRTYVFRLRPDVRFSNGRPVRPTDVRASFERFFTMRHYTVLPIYTHIAGAAACSPGRRCDLSRGIVADNRAGTVTFHLSSPDPEFLYTLALPPGFVVPGDSTTATAKRPLPGTGPYRIAFSVSSRDERRRPGRLVLVQNPAFRVFAPDATPNGFPNRIVVTTMLASAKQVAAVERGTADVASQLTNLSPGIARRLASHEASQLHLDSIGATDYVFLNTRVPPFDRLDARRAVNEAVDRSRLVQLLGGPQTARPTCQILPPDFPGYRPYCPYGLKPSPAGTWNGPNLGRARKLVAASGTKGMHITMWASPHHVAVARYFASLLRRLGYRATTRVVPGVAGSATPYYNAVANPKTRAQIGTVGWIQDYASAADFVSTLFDCKSFVPGDPAATYNYSEVCEPALERQIHAAERVQAQDPVAGQQAWAAADRMIVDQAVAVPYANTLALTLISRRTGNYESSPQWGVLLDQLWVR